MRVTLSSFKASDDERSAAMIVAGKQPITLTLKVTISSDDKLDFSDPFLPGSLKAGIYSAVQQALIDEGFIKVENPLLKRW